MENTVDNHVVDLARAIREKESGHNFSAIGDSGTSRGGYQYQPDTWKRYAREILGDENAQLTPENQNAVAYGKIKKWKDEGKNDADIVAAWNAGEDIGFTGKWVNHIGRNEKLGVDYNTPQYVKDVYEIYNKIKGINPVAQYPTLPEMKEQEKADRIALGEPVSTIPGRAEPTLIGNAIRGIIRLPARYAQNIAATRNALGRLGTDVLSAIKGEETAPREEFTAPVIQSKYLGTVSPVGFSKEGKPLKGSEYAKDVTGSALEAASYLPGVGAAGTTARGVSAGLRGAGQLFKTGLISGLEGAASGFLGGAGSSLQRQETLPQATGKGLLGGLTGGLIGGGLGVGGTALTQAGREALSSAIPKTSARELALDLVKPIETEETLSKAFRESRIGQPGVFTKAPILPSRKEELLADAVAPLFETGELTSDMTEQQIGKVLSNKVKEINTGVKRILSENNVPINDTELVKRILNKQAESSFLFTGDETAEKAYQGLMNGFLSELKGKDLVSLFDARQSFDKTIEKLAPNLKKYFKGQLGENVKATAYDDIRTVANEYIADLLPENNPYRSQLLREHYLLEALNNVEEKFVKTKGGSKFGKFFKSPTGKLTSGLLKSTGAGAGIYGGAKLIEKD